ncbi:MAG: sigma 54-interacting transcriptional regulator [Candidatus Thermoplasmatota archaeon]|nr:sigma 54-interacting transcriptional regulator [Candidatus Thermoplasmatota archaeon]
MSEVKTTAAKMPKDAREFVPPGVLFQTHLNQLLEGLRGKGLSREEAIASLFPGTILPVETYEDVLTTLFSRSHLILFGPSGSGKTNLAKDLWDLFPKEHWVVDGCPLLDHPASLFDEATFDSNPPCPICVRRFSPDGSAEAFDPKAIAPEKIPVKMAHLREGFGFARLQGSSEVFPDHLTGNINLVKLEELGDPMNPLVLEPGKLLQANRGFLLVDEIGKLPLGTQNVLLQALQEGTVTPAKSRESFPSRFIAVCTSNLSDLDNINDPLSDRLTSVHVEFNKLHRRNRRIVELARAKAPAFFLPVPLLDTGVRMIELWRLKMADDNPDVGEVGSNRTMIDIASRTEAYAELRGHPIPTYDDLKAGLLHGMRGRIRARSGDSFDQNSHLVEDFVSKNLEDLAKRSATSFWCNFFRGPLGGNQKEGEAVVAEGRRLSKDNDLRSRVAKGESLFENFQKFSRHVTERGGIPEGFPALEAAIATFDLLDRFSLFRCEEGTEAD